MQESHHSRRKAFPTPIATPRPAEPPSSPRSILLVKTSSLGDVIHNLPVASDLIQRYPNARIDWLVEEAFKDIPRLHPAIHRVIPVALRRWRKALLKAATWQEIRAFRHELQSQAYDLILDTQGLIKSALLTRLALRTPEGRRCGYAAEAAREPLAARFYDHRCAIPKNIHAVERNRWLAAAICNQPPPHLLDYGLSPSNLPSQTDLQVAQRPAYAVLLTATSRDDKLWPEENWGILLEALSERGLHVILPAGSEKERERAKRIAFRLNPPSGASLVPPQSIAQLAELCRHATLVIGLDTGLTHLAAALGRPTIALFCASNPGLTGVYTGEPPATPALNLGQDGHPPGVAEVIAALDRLAI